MDNLIIPMYSRVVRHPVLNEYQVSMDDVLHIDYAGTENMVDLGDFAFAPEGFNPADEGTVVVRKIVRVTRRGGDATGERTFLMLDGDMLAEYEQLKASSCRSVVLVDCSVGHAFAIGSL